MRGTSPLKDVTLLASDIANAFLYLASEQGRCVNVGTIAAQQPQLLLLASGLQSHASQRCKSKSDVPERCLGVPCCTGMQGHTLVVDLGLVVGVTGEQRSNCSSNALPSSMYTHASLLRGWSQAT